MTKEQVLILLKDSVANLRTATKHKLNPDGRVKINEKGYPELDNPFLFDAWKRQCDRVRSEVGLLSPNDFKWVDQEYSRWYRETFTKDIRTHTIE